MNFKDLLLKLLKTDSRILDSEGELMGNKIQDLADKTDEKLIEILLDNPETRAKFFLQIKDAFVFKTADFKFYIDENKIDNSYTQYENRIGLTSKGKFLKDSNNVVLDFPYKDCILEGGQSTEEGTDTYFEWDDKDQHYTEKQAKRKEIFFNSVLAKDEIDRLLEPKAFSNVKKYTIEGAQNLEQFERDDNGTIKDNLIIKGNNLLALHSLKKEFAGKVKLIYIDPPFNTGNDSFAYNDSFNHSTWLAFMRNRLINSRELLKNNGIIFINIDAIEEAYLKVLCDEIYGRENFINVITVKSSTPSGTKTAHKDKTIIKQKDLILVYKRGGDLTLKPQYTRRENWDNHYSLVLEKDKNENHILRKLVDLLKEKSILLPNQKLENLSLENKEFKEFYLKNSNKICRLQSHKNKQAEKVSRSKKDQVHEHFESNISKGLYFNGQVITPLSQGIKKVYSNQKFVNDLGILLCDFWSDIDFQNTQNEGGVSFPTAKKPETLLSRIIELSTDKGDIVLDYHLGSGTTCAVSHKMNRQYIGIEQLDYGKNDSTKRLENVINGDQSGLQMARWRLIRISRTCQKQSKCH
jgi:adenine-specific DNA-methyltransferase